MLAKLLPILGVTFVDILGFSILIPILPYFVKHFGASDIVVGMLFSVYFGFQFLAGPLWGYASDRIGRKMVLIVSQIGATIGWVMLAFAGTIATVFVARIVEGASGGNISLTQAYVADLVEPKQRGRAFGYLGAAFSAGFVGGPLIGGTLLDMYGFSATFLVAAGLQFVTLVLTIIMLPESRRRVPDAEVARFADIGRSLANPRVAPLLWQIWAYSLALYAWFGVLALYLMAALHWSAVQVTFAFAAWGVCSAIMQIGVTGRLTEALGDRAASNIGLLATFCAFGITPFTHSFAVFVPQFLLFAIGMSIARPSLASLLAGEAPANQRGAILGTGSALDNLSGVLMPPLSTAALQRYGSPLAGVPSIVFSTIALIMGLVAHRKARLAAAASAELAALQELAK